MYDLRTFGDSSAAGKHAAGTAEMGEMLLSRQKDGGKMAAVGSLLTFDHFFKNKWECFGMKTENMRSSRPNMGSSQAKLGFHHISPTKMRTCRRKKVGTSCGKNWETLTQRGRLDPPSLQHGEPSAKFQQCDHYEKLKPLKETQV